MQIAQAGASSLYIVQDGCYLCGKRGIDMTEPVEVLQITAGATSLALPVYACKPCNEKRRREAQPEPESSTQWVQEAMF